MPPNIINYNKKYYISDSHDSEFKHKSKEEIINEILLFDVHLAINDRSEVIVPGEPLQWNLEYLQNMDQYSLSLLLEFIKVKNEKQKSDKDT